MAAYAIMRIEKIKTAAEFTKVQEHNYRLTKVLNANPEHDYRNEEIIRLEHGTLYDAFKDKISKSEYHKTRKIRKDSVKGLEILMTYSEDYSRNINLQRWKEENKKWIIETFGKDNVVSIMYHGDESTPHIHTIVIPIYDGRLSAYRMLGNRHKMRSLQDSYAKAMEQFGLERGLRNSVAKHTDIQKFYASLNHELDKELPEPLVNENVDDYRFRANQVYQKANMKHYNEKLTLERAIDENKTKILNIKIYFKERIRELANKLKKFEDLEHEFGSYDQIRNTLVENLAFKNGLQNMTKESPHKAKQIDAFQEQINEIIMRQMERDEMENAKKKREKIFEDEDTRY